MAEAQNRSFPLRLIWLLLETYAQPRVIRAYGCWSSPTRAQQGRRAGCTHATTLLTVLTYRAIERVHDMYKDVMPRALVDDNTFQWTGNDMPEAANLQRAVHMFSQEAGKLGMLIKFGKSGFVANAKRALEGFQGRAQKLRLPAKGWIRNIGHEMPGARPVRKQAQARMTSLRG
eukprot:4536310-Pyramimonas_sp.AAC.1